MKKICKTSFITIISAPETCRIWTNGNLSVQHYCGNAAVVSQYYDILFLIIKLCSYMHWLHALSYCIEYCNVNSLFVKPSLYIYILCAHLANIYRQLKHFCLFRVAKKSWFIWNKKIKLKLLMNLTKKLNRYFYTIVKHFFRYIFSMI